MRHGIGGGGKRRELSRNGEAQRLFVGRGDIREHNQLTEEEREGATMEEEKEGGDTQREGEGQIAFNSIWCVEQRKVVDDYIWPRKRVANNVRQRNEANSRGTNGDDAGFLFRSQNEIQVEVGGVGVGVVSGRLQLVRLNQLIQID